MSGQVVLLTRSQPISMALAITLAALQPLLISATAIMMGPVLAYNGFTGLCVLKTQEACLGQLLHLIKPDHMVPVAWIQLDIYTSLKAAKAAP
jgi:hypothetical protein